MIGAGLVERILARLGLPPGRDREADDARLRELERRLAAVDTRIAVKERVERERRFREQEGWHRGD